MKKSSGEKRNLRAKSTGNQSGKAYSATDNKKSDHEFELMNFAMNKVHEAAFFIDENAHFQYVNENACKVLGYTRDELLHLTVADVDPDCPFERWIGHWNDLQTQESLMFEGRHKTKDGRIFPVEIHANYFNYEGRSYNLALVREITERKRVEDILHKSEERFRGTLDNMLEGCMLIGYDWTYLYVNNSAALHGQETPENIIGRTMLEKYPGVENTEIFAGYKRCMEERIPQHLELPFTFSNDITNWYEHSVQPVPEGIFVLSLDITERKKNEELLKHSESRLNEAQRVAHIGSWELDLVKNVLIWSDEIYCMFEIDPKQFGASYEAFLNAIHPEDRNAVNAAFTSSVENKSPYSIDHRLLFPDGRIRYVHEQCETFYDTDGKPFRSVGTVQDITDRKLAEETIFEGQQVFRTLVENSPDIIARYNRNCQRIYVNPVYLKVAQIPKEKLLDKSPIEQSPLPAVSAAVLQNLVRKVLDTGVAEGIDIKWPKADNIDCWYNVSASPEFDHFGNVVSVMTISHDITHRKLSEAQILKLNRIYAVLSNINQAIVRIHETKEILTEACRIAVDYGKFKMAWIGLVNLQTNKVDVVASNGVSGRYLKKINIDLNGELRSRGPSGTTITTGKHMISNDIANDDSMIPWRNDAIKYGYKSSASFPLIVFDKIVGAFSIYSIETNFFHKDYIKLLDEIAKDISFALEFIETETKRKHVEDSLQKFKLATEQSPALIVITDIDGNIEYVNPKFTEISGYSFEEVRGQNPRILKTGEMSKDAYKILWETILTGAIWRGEFHNRRKNGTLYWESASISSIKDSDGKITHFIGVKADITEQKRLEQDLREAKEKAEEMSRLKSSLLLNMSHELRTPMNGILGFAGLLKEQPLDHDSLKMVDIISSSGRRLMTTLNSILDLAQVEAGKQNVQVVPVHLSESIRKIQLPYIEQAEEKHLTFISNVEENLYSLLDERLFQNVIHHLLDNAIKFTESGRISLILKKDEQKEKSFATIIVKDTGIGIQSNKSHLIFDAFRQGSEGIGRSYEGPGLGLTLCKKFVELLNGFITVDSIPDIGSTFTVRLPLYSMTTDDLLFKPVTSEIRVLKEPSEFLKDKEKPRVLIVEDNEANCELMEIYLSKFCQTDKVHSGRQAVKFAFMNQYDLILMDINLGPDMDGIQATKEIRMIENYQSVPIIAVTGFSTAEEKAKILSNGLDRFLTKPFTREELLRVVESIIR